MIIEEKLQKLLDTGEKMRKLQVATRDEKQKMGKGSAGKSQDCRAGV